MKRALLVLAVLVLLAALPAAVAAKRDGRAPAWVIDQQKAGKDKTAKEAFKTNSKKGEQEEPAGKKAEKACATIQRGQILSGDGIVIETGYDAWGCNYRARKFNGTYGDAARAGAGCQEWENVRLRMKWDRAWLSDKDCAGDGRLDRHDGFDGCVGSRAQRSNHMRREYAGED